MKQENLNVKRACEQLILNLDCNRFHESPYYAPFINYLETWPYSLPIKTILIGQNPYPQSIYPEYGAALSYDESKVKKPPGSVVVIAEDLFNYDDTPKQDTINCFRDLWTMSDAGIIAINETVFSKIVESEKSSNLRPTKEAEYQIRALQTLIAESYFMGQKTIECIAMGMSAAMMSSLLRGWCPNDLISLKIVTCTNPAAFARNLRDCQSQPITIGNNIVSKILSSIVRQYVAMPPRRDVNRAQQNEESLRKTTSELVTSSSALRGEYSSFAERLKKVVALPEAKSTLEDLSDALTNLIASTDRHALAVNAQTTSFLMTVNAAKAQVWGKPGGPSSNQGQVTTAVVSPQLPILPPPILSTPTRRRVVRRTTSEISATPIESIKEEESETASQAPIASPLAARTGFTGTRRRVARRVSQALSAPDTEYTNVESIASENPKPLSKEEIGPVEKVHMRSIAEWFANNMNGDTTYSEMLETSASQGVVGSSISRKVLAYIQSRMNGNGSYDAYDEQEKSDSDTSRWCRGYMKSL